MVEKQEIRDALEVYRRNMAHILGDKDEQVQVIETCQMLADEVEDHEAEWEDVEINSEDKIETWQCAKCSNCGLYTTIPYRYYYHHYDYCPNCGAKMKQSETGGEQ